jgi:hypothetical protein
LGNLIPQAYLAFIKVASRSADATDVTQAMQNRFRQIKKEKTFSFF